MEMVCNNAFDLAEITPGKVRVLQDELLKLPQADIVTEHTFLPKVYERKITIPPWVVLTGAEHKTPYRVRLEKGTIAVNTENGVKVLTGPCEFDAAAGMQRAGRVFEDEVVWVDVYSNPDDCIDIAELENRLYVIPACGLAASRTEAQKAMIAYQVFLLQLGVSKQDATDAVKNAFESNAPAYDMCSAVAYKMQFKAEKAK